MFAENGEIIVAALRDWRSKRHLEYWKSITKQRHVKLLNSRLSLNKTGELLRLNRNHLKSVTGYHHLKRHLYKLVLVDNPILAGI
jgi:hypothetical protein